MKKKYDVIIYEPGAVFLDLIFAKLPSMPILGKEIFAEHFEIAPGGAANTAIALARLGLNVALLAVTGNDLISNFLEQQLALEGVDTSHMHRLDENARAITASLSFPKDRAFVSHVDKELVFDFPSQLLSSDRCKCLLFLQMTTNPKLLNLARKARKAGIKTAMDMHLNEGTIKDKKVINCLRSIDLILPNASEAKAISEKNNIRQAARKLAQHTNVVVKDGAKGAIYTQGKKIERIEAIKGKVVDTTGAGDCLNAGFLSGWVQNLPFKECLARGCANASLSVTKLGGSVSAPNIKEFQRALATYGYSYKPPNKSR